MQLKLIIIGLLVSTALGYFYYSQTKIQNLTALNAQLTQQNEQYKLAVSELEAAMRRQAELTTQFDNQAREAKKLATEALNALDNHNLELLSFAKPKLIEKRINSATSKLFEEIENEINN